MRKKSRGPDFLCIGPQRTGTTWLYHTLCNHPQVFLPQFKEIAYFNEELILPHSTFFKRFSSKHWIHTRLKKHMKMRVKFYLKHILHIDKRYIKMLKWDFKFYLQKHTLQWYTSLFTSSAHKINGDITPLYYNLPEQEIERIARAFPWLKIIVFHRNPIDRVWSKARMNLLDMTGKSFNSVPEQKFYDIFDKQHQKIPSYMAVVDRWEKHFPGKLHVNFYDKLQEDPTGFYTDICHFLEIDPGGLPDKIFNNLKKRVNSGVDVGIPEKFAVYLAKRCSSCIDEMCEHYESYPQLWAKQRDSLLS